MPSSRRTFLAGALTTAAGCVDTTTDRDDPGGDGSTEEPATPPGPPSYAHWTYETPHDAFGTLSLAPGAGGPAVYVGSDVPRGGPRGTPTVEADHSLHAISLPEGTEQWNVALPNPVRTAPVVGGHGGPDRLYLATGPRSRHGEGWELHALEYARGERVWGFDTKDRRALYPLAATDDAVFVGRRDDRVAEDGEYAYALEATDGTERWRVESGDVELGEIVLGGNAVRRGTVFLRTPRRLRALDPETGDERWRVEAESRLDGPVYDNRGKRVTVGHDGTVRALALQDGSELWRREVDFAISRLATPRQAMDDTVFVGDRDGRLLALSSLDGGTRWTLNVDREPFHPTVQRTSETLFVDGAGVHALDPVSGERTWSYTPDVEGRVAVDASTGVFASVRGEFVAALDPETGEERWRFAPDGAVTGPAAAGDVAVVGVGGTVYALDGSREG